MKKNCGLEKYEYIKDMVLTVKDDIFVAYKDGILYFSNNLADIPKESTDYGNIKNNKYRYYIEEKQTVEWKDKKSSINGVEILNEIIPIDMNAWFYGLEKVTYIKGVENINTTFVSNMENTFSTLINIEKLDLSNFNTSNVTTMNSMFNKCIKLKEINISNFNTSNVTDMSVMFNRCKSLTSLNLSNFDTSNVTNMFGMFSECEKLSTLNLSSWNTKKVVNVLAFADSCINLKHIYVGEDWDVSKASEGNGENEKVPMFEYSSKLPNYYLDNEHGKNQAHTGEGGYLEKIN